MEKSEVDLWRCNSCLNKTDVSNDIIDLEKKIHDLKVVDSLDHEMSLTLAAEEQYSPKTFVTPSILCPSSNNLLSSPISSTFETLTVPGLDSQTSSKKLTQAETSSARLTQVETGGDRQTSPKKLNWDKNFSQEQGTNLGQKMPLPPYTAKKLASGETLEEFFLKNIEDALSFRNDSSLIRTKRFSWAINSWKMCQLQEIPASRIKKTKSLFANGPMTLNSGKIFHDLKKLPPKP
ncbi:hypothetical protein J6590_082549 [Homalodisca vitripennis]|nr:hypothetical protein J6590_082549 [Homalodisca vitripennis]